MLIHKINTKKCIHLNQVDFNNVTIWAGREALFVIIRIYLLLALYCCVYVEDCRERCVSGSTQR